MRGFPEVNIDFCLIDTLLKSQYSHIHSDSAKSASREVILHHSSGMGCQFTNSFP